MYMIQKERNKSEYIIRGIFFTIFVLVSCVLYAINELLATISSVGTFLIAPYVWDVLRNNGIYYTRDLDIKIPFFMVSIPLIMSVIFY